MSSRSQPSAQPESQERGHSRQRRQRQERRESSRSKIEQHRRSHHEQEPEGSTAEIIENLEPCECLEKSFTNKLVLGLTQL